MADKKKIAGKRQPAKPRRPHAGQPAKFTEREVMQDKINEYFTECDSKEPPQPYTIADLAYHLDMTTHSLRNYQKSEKFFTIINKAKLKIEGGFERRLTSGSATGSIFWLKNHAGYKDLQDINHGGEVTINKIVREIVKA